MQHRSHPLQDWRKAHLGFLMGLALRRFDARVLQLMASDDEIPLALSNLALRGQISAAHIHITRHLPLEGARLVDLAHNAGMSKQAMAKLIKQCEAWGIVQVQRASLDARAKHIAFTNSGLAWLNAFKNATQQAQNEFRDEVGADFTVIISLGLEAYINGVSLSELTPHLKKKVQVKNNQLGRI